MSRHITADQVFDALSVGGKFRVAVHALDLSPERVLDAFLRWVKETSEPPRFQNFFYEDQSRISDFIGVAIRTARRSDAEQSA